MKSADIRQKFLQYFESHGHTIVPSSALIPANDPSLLFTNSGMVQFKDVFLGQDTRPYKRATSAQRCVRAGGKHNDLENVGYTARHHTFFEMLGNFSFGDYFKRDAIRYAWELLTQVYRLPSEKLWVTVYYEDDEAYQIWATEIGVPAARIIRIGDNKGARYASDNFWQMADTGPCGPCSEIFYDHGPDVWGGPPGSPEQDGDRYIEIWNLVFMQYERSATGELTPLPRPCVDTGMGLERIAAVLQGVHSNYEIDTFQHLIAAAAQLTGCSDLNHSSLKVIADHIRACAFMIVDGVIPSNEGRGYVLRRIIRRALRHGHKLGQTQAFFYRLVQKLSEEMGSAYPELVKQAQRVADVLQQEEIRFGETLENGMKILDEALVLMQQSGRARLDGHTIFTLYDTYGFPVDLTADICREKQLDIDLPGFESAMQQQRDQARAAGKFKQAATLSYQGQKTDFQGYEQLEQQQATVLAIYQAGISVASAGPGHELTVVLDRTPFYAESGGQVGDVGKLSLSSDTTRGTFIVQDTQKIQNDVFGHQGYLDTGVLKIGDKVNAEVDAEQRVRIARHHSATHLLHRALRQVLGEHVQQKGSLVDADKTRFDFSHGSPLNEAQIKQIERLVNQEIMQNKATRTELMAFDDAVKSGAMALFGEKYADKVRVLEIGFSKELCGGTHVSHTGDIGLFKIVAETGIAAGVRRIEAVAGTQALAYVDQQETLLTQAAHALRVAPAELGIKVTQLLEQSKLLEKELLRYKTKLAAQQGEELLSQAVNILGVSVLAVTLEDVESKALRPMLDQLKSKLKSAVILLATVEGDKVSLAAAVTPDIVNKLSAGELVKFVAQQLGGKGGGRPDMAMAGANNPQNLPQALASIHDWVETSLNTH